MIAVIDYGAGNLRNVCKALEHVGGRLKLTDDRRVIASAEKVVLPGVGAFADCRNGLVARGLFELLRDLALAGKPLLGICVGMQLLFEVGEEMGEWKGLGLIGGRVVRFRGPAFEGARALKVPHIGWNQLHLLQPHHPLLRSIPPDSYAYFVHSYHAQPMDAGCVLATTDYGYHFPAIVARGNVWGVQFHPEKSQDVGLRLLRNFVEHTFAPVPLSPLHQIAEE
ncbi:MAG: imidazole glycerol phosphate synthase subunit HisH [Thermoflexales bacterium]